MIGRPLWLAFLTLLIASTAFAQEKELQDDVKPQSNDAAISETTPETEAAFQTDRFGAAPTDPAYGAFQRGLYVTALNLALPRAENGDVAAQMLAADIYARGLGVPKNIPEATRWFMAAAELGEPEAQLQAGLILLGPKPTDRTNPNRAEAISMLEAASAQDNAVAAFNLGQLYLSDMPSEAGLIRAAPLFEIAAKGKVAAAQYALAQFYAEGTGGIAQDDIEARKWLKASAEQGFDSALVDYATWLAEGRGGPFNYDAAFRLMSQSAMSGNIAGQLRLSKLYRFGLGNDGDPILAAAWYISAKRAGLDDPEMDDFLEGLTTEERTEASKKANDLVQPKS